ncbi:universal stress protein [Segetibacter koreensis]|uniref:universal stress protein n=1 Tax=Segetibacter koreensis TaxID=398037 RepID=UPI0003688EE6|nr:universal stress protein [Segetibacter koreensis]
MIKVIAALDALKLSESTVDYSVYFAKEFNAHIVAAFLEEMVYHARPEADEDYVFTDWSQMDTLVKKEEQLRAVSKKNVQTRFEAEGVNYNIHRDKTFALKSLLRESHYSDMILIDENEKFSNWDSSKPSLFMKNLLSDADCPVIVVPAEFKPIEKFVFAYDGSPSSVYAIRQFSYLFPATPLKEVEILMITDDKHSNHFPNQHLLKELLKRKYATVLQSIIKSDHTDEALVKHLQAENKNCMLILGAYQRSSFSRWLYQSIADLLIAEVEIPLFIAHK